MERSEVVSEIAELIYKHFIVNDKAVALQGSDGKYYTKYFNYDQSLLNKMLMHKGSLGIYQQPYNQSKVRWVCLDFDLKDKSAEQEQVLFLFNSIVDKLIVHLDEIKISYTLEFSGRRGIHVWIFFDRLVLKARAFGFVKYLKNVIQSELSEHEDKIGLDLFPASSIGSNKVGKQVKCPLSFHQMGTYSFFIDKDNLSLEKISSLSVDFLEGQKIILSNIKKNNFEDFVHLFDIPNIPNISYENNSLKLESEKGFKDIYDCLYELDAFRLILDKLNGDEKISYIERIILLSTLIHINDQSIFVNFMKLNRYYNEDITEKQIKKYRNIYWPLDFKSIYYLMDMNKPEEIDGNVNILRYIEASIGGEIKTDVYVKRENEFYSSEILLKEMNYFKHNDEVQDVEIMYNFKNMNLYDLKEIEAEILSIKQGKIKTSNPRFEVYVRKESIDKDRKLVSLDAKDRIITTSIILQLRKLIDVESHSYSYNVNPMKTGDIFFPWYNSWENYKKTIVPFFELDFLAEYSFFKLDLHNFYDSILFHSVYRDVVEKNQLDSESINMLDYILEYNSIIMKDISGHNKGVPQGPAYARIISEIYLDIILSRVFSKYSIKDGKDGYYFKYYRYVDDIYIIYDKFEKNDLIVGIKHGFTEYGLQLNEHKTKFYGVISSIKEDEKNDILYSNLINYDITDASNMGFIDSRFVRDTIFKFTQGTNEFDINKSNFILSEFVEEKISSSFIKKYASKLFSSEIGRGSIFRKLYGLILKNDELLNWFITEEYYKLIPIDSINYSNFLHCLYYLVEENLSTQILHLVKLIVKNSIKNENYKNNNIIQAFERLVSEA